MTDFIHEQNKQKSNPTVKQIQPFVIDISLEAIEDLKERLVRTRWPDLLPDTGWERGASLPYIKVLIPLLTD